jgi:hypothetical protein
MSSLEDELRRLRQHNAELQREVERLKADAAAKQVQGPGQPPAVIAGGATANGCSSDSLPAWDGLKHGLNKVQIARYSRQIVLHSFGVQGAQ